jgi:hypothetical protein
MRPVGIVGINDRVSLVGSLQVVRLHRTRTVLTVKSVANERTTPVDL